MSSNLTKIGPGCTEETDGALSLEEARDLWEKFLWAIAQTAELMRSPKSYGLKELWYSQDIHVLVGLAENPNLTASALAKSLAVSRSAVTQVVQKLESKGVLVRYATPGNRKEKLHRLTEAGEAVVKAHKEFHERIEASALKALTGQPAALRESLEFLIGLLNARADLVRNEIDRDSKTRGSMIEGSS
jgi:DNA-binding MarR family transcriptional regulator